MKPGEHENCGAQWICLGCEKSVCTRCNPSPAEEELCADCFDPEDDAA